MSEDAKVDMLQMEKLYLGANRRAAIAEYEREALSLRLDAARDAHNEELARMSHGVAEEAARADKAEAMLIVLREQVKAEQRRADAAEMALKEQREAMARIAKGAA